MEVPVSVPASAPGVPKGKARQPELDKQIQTNLDELSTLEREKCAIPDEAADTFALLLRDMAALSPPA